MKIILCILFTSVLMVVQAQEQKFSKYSFYEAMKTDDTLKINKQLALLKSTSVKEKDVYEGALLMKKAGTNTHVKSKLNDFKAGRLKLETGLEKDSTNTEYHFLRLMIQEHAPKILNYHADLEKDNNYIRKNFAHLSKELQQTMIDYSKRSKIMKNIGAN